MSGHEIASEELEGRWPKDGLWLGALIAGLIGGLLLLGVLVSAPFANAGGFLGRGHSGWHHGSPSPEAMQERAEYAAEWVLRYVDASEEQQAQVNAIIERSIGALAPLREDHAENRRALLEAFRQPQVDRDQLEAIRQAELALADTASRELVNAFAALAEVLTPEQRAELLELGERFHR